MASWYYYNENGEKVGPVKDSEFKQLVRQGAITPKTLIETESGQKAKAEKVKGLFPSSPVSASVSVAASPIAFTCSSCGRSLKVKNELAGRTLRCPTCQSTITVPVGEPTPFSLPMTPDWGDAMANLLEESARMDAIKAQNEKERVLREAQPVRHPGSDAPVLITPEQLASKITLKNAKNVSGGILFLMLSAVFWLIDYLIVLAVSALFWIVIVNGDQQPESDYGAAIFFTSLVLFVLLGGLGYYYAHTVYTQERDERKTFGGDGFSLMFFFAGARIYILWMIVTCAPKMTWMGIHHIRQRLSPSPPTLDLAAKLYNEMAADQHWRLLPGKEPHRSATMLLATLELIRCSPNKQNGFDIRVPSKETDW